MSPPIWQSACLDNPFLNFDHSVEKLEQLKSNEKMTMTTIVPMMKWEIVVVAQSGSALGFGARCTPIAGGGGINFLPQSLFFSPKSYQQTISRMQNFRFPKISFETRNIKTEAAAELFCTSPAISVLFQTGPVLQKIKKG